MIAARHASHAFGPQWQAPRAPQDIKGHVVGILIADGSETKAINKLKAAFKKAGAVAKVIALIEAEGRKATSARRHQGRGLSPRPRGQASQGRGRAAARAAPRQLDRYVAVARGSLGRQITPALGRDFGRENQLLCKCRIREHPPL
ncbi:hypothetical protein [Caulobacter endophyticus]|uniref:hypothetical protein n=1 Tax=Caulobacter endophyticus TaxID=2172652 RepID=UPI00240FEF46|nr:hypothetical protein [Caulobacter endophyticus]MDG2530438.1 hypothetical protein [Caulobacter endophyticus]